MRFFFLPLLLLMLIITGCGGAPKVDVPPYAPLNLHAAQVGNPPDFLIESVDLIDYRRAGGKARNSIIGAESDVEMGSELLKYFESKSVMSLQEKGYDCAWYTGPGYFASLSNTEAAPMRLRLELQDLAMGRTSKKNLRGDHIVGNCKVRGVLFDKQGDLLYSRQFVGQINTERLSEQLVPSGVRFISHKGLNSLLENLLEQTVQDFRDGGIPEIIEVRNSYVSSWESPSAPVIPEMIQPVQPVQPEPIAPRLPVEQEPMAAPEPVEPPQNESNPDDVEWVW